MKQLPFKLIFASIILATTLASCFSEEEGTNNTVEKEILDENNSFNTVFDGKIFSIPSPVQTAYLIKQLDLPFDETLLNKNSNVGKYVKENNQALNLGIYGTDVGYASMYEQKDITMKYLSSVEKLTSELGLDIAFDNAFLKRFEKNNGNKDSMLVIMTDAYRKSDNFLKQSNRKSTSALILAGGWIESIYFATKLNAKKQNTDVEKRIGEQKQSLNSIIDILTEYNANNQNDLLIAEMKDLKVSFDKIQMNYKYSAPETDKDKKLTTFTHSLEIILDKKILGEIESKIEAIRSNIIKG
jgi:hypothetical protein